MDRPFLAGVERRSSPPRWLGLEISFLKIHALFCPDQTMKEFNGELVPLARWPGFWHTRRVDAILLLIPIGRYLEPCAQVEPF